MLVAAALSILACLCFGSAVAIDDARHNRNLESLENTVAADVPCQFEKLDALPVVILRDSFFKSTKRRFLKIVPDPVHGLKLELYRLKTSWFSSQVEKILRSAYYLDDVEVDTRYPLSLTADLLDISSRAAVDQYTVNLTLTQFWREGKPMQPPSKKVLTITPDSEEESGLKARANWLVAKCFLERAINAVKIPYVKTDPPKFCVPILAKELLAIHGKADYETQRKATPAQQIAAGSAMHNVCAAVPRSAASGTTSTTGTTTPPQSVPNMPALKGTGSVAAPSAAGPIQGPK